MGKTSLIKVTKNNYKTKLTDWLTNEILDGTVEFQKYHDKLSKEMGIPYDPVDDKEKFKKEYKKELLHSLSKGKIVLYIIKLINNSSIAGYIIVSKRHWYDNDPKKPTINELYIKPQYRQQYIGKETLMKVIIDLKNNFHAKYVALSVYINNNSALRLYQSIGFQTVFYQMFITKKDFIFDGSNQMDNQGINIIDASIVDKFENNKNLKEVINLMAKQYTQLFPIMRKKHFQEYFTFENFKKILKKKDLKTFAVFDEKTDKIRHKGLLLFITRFNKLFSMSIVVDMIPLASNIDFAKSLHIAGLNMLFEKMKDTTCICTIPITNQYSQYSLRKNILEQIGFRPFLKHMIFKI